MDKSRKKVFIIAAAVVLAAVGVLCCVIAFTNRQSGDKPGQIVAVSDESDVFFDFEGDIASEKEAQNATCIANVSDGAAHSFELRFSRREDIDALLSGGENIYFASVDYGSGPVAIPMDNIKILTDITTGEYVLTLVPADGDVDAERAAGSEVRFYITPPETGSSCVLFMATAVCEK